MGFKCIRCSSAPARRSRIAQTIVLSHHRPEQELLHGRAGWAAVQRRLALGSRARAQARGLEHASGAFENARTCKGGWNRRSRAAERVARPEVRTIAPLHGRSEPDTRPLYMAPGAPADPGVSKRGRHNAVNKPTSGGRSVVVGRRWWQKRHAHDNKSSAVPLLMVMETSFTLATVDLAHASGPVHVSKSSGQVLSLS